MLKFSVWYCFQTNMDTSLPPPANNSWLCLLSSGGSYNTKKFAWNNPPPLLPQTRAQLTGTGNSSNVSSTQRQLPSIVGKHKPINYIRTHTVLLQTHKCIPSAINTWWMTYLSPPQGSAGETTPPDTRTPDVGKHPPHCAATAHRVEPHCTPHTWHLQRIIAH